MLPREEDGAQPLPGFREGLVAPWRDGTRLSVPALRYAWGGKCPFDTELCGE